MKKRVACIAVGGYARSYLNAMIAEALAGRVELVACADPQPPADFDEAVAALGAARPTLYRNHREMLAQESALDLVTIGTGLHLHAPMLLDALAAGCHVLLAKPAAVTVQSIDAMIAAKNAAAKEVVVDFQHTYAGATAHVMEAIAAGRLGRVREITTTLLWHRPDSYYTRNNWSGKFKLNGEYVLDGPLSNPHAHYLNNAFYFAHPDPRQFAVPVTVRAELYRMRPLETEDNACLEIQTDTGVTIRHYSSLTSDFANTTRAEISGERGRAVWSFEQSMIDTGQGEESTEFPRATSAMVVARFLDFLGGTAPAPLTTLEAARSHVLALNGAWESARQVRDIPAEFKLVSERDGNPWRVVDGIDEWMRLAASQGQLYSDIACPWAQATNPFDLTGYREMSL